MILALVATYLLTVTYAALTGALLRSGRVMLGLALIATLLLPLLLGWKLRVVGPRFLAAVNALALIAVLFFAGERADQALASHGPRVFSAVSTSKFVHGLGTLTVDGLRFVARRGAPDERVPVDPAQPSGGGVAEARPADGQDGGSRVTTTPSPDAGPKAAPEAVPDAEPTLDNPIPEDPGPTDSEVLVIPITEGGGTFEVGAIVNGSVPATFVFDSGAHDVSITTVLARRLKISNADAVKWRIYHTANGKVRQPVVVIDSVDLGEGFVVEDVEGSICAGCSENLLGRSFQKHFLVEIDAKASEVRLRRN